MCVRSERESGMGSSVVELTVLFPSFGRINALVRAMIVSLKVICLGLELMCF